MDTGWIAAVHAEDASSPGRGVARRRRTGKGVDSMRFRLGRVRAFIGLASLVIASGGGCSSGNNGGSGSSGSTTCSGASSSDPCHTCEFSNCCDQFTACGNNGACANLANCAQACTSQSCLDSCANQFPGGVSDFNTFSDCLVDFCSTCASTSSGSSSSSGSGTGSSTSSTSSGSSGSVCHELTGTCSVSTDCCGALVCRSGSCENPCLELTGTCSVSTDCCGVLVCKSGSCGNPGVCKQNGASCIIGSDCCSGQCFAYANGPGLQCQP
jgi:hypothetical protein